MNREKQFINTFILPDRKPKLCALLDNQIRRRAYLGKALHSYDFLTEHCVEIAESDQKPEGIAQLLKVMGATDTCYAISELEDLDGRAFKLIEALTQILGKGFGSILICNDHGTLGYYEGSDMEERMILLKK